VDSGGLIAYAPNYAEHFVGAAPYIDRILKGTRPGELPVQISTKFDLVINLKAANALGLAVPQALLVGATEVIEYLNDVCFWTILLKKSVLAAADLR
jgi:putative ABC transport system substrate-binding protein